MNNLPEKKEISQEEIKLKFRDVYNSPEWKELDAINRAQLLLVAEEVKPGTIISGDFTYFPDIIKKLGLEVSMNTPPMRLNPVYCVAKAEELSTYFRKLISLPEREVNAAYDIINGEFLGYPECCTEEYIYPTHDYDSNLDFELKALLNNNEQYPKELDFCPPAFTPCSANCPEALKTLSLWQKVLEHGDPEAAEALKRFNQQDDLMQEFQEVQAQRTEDTNKKIREIILS